MAAANTDKFRKVDGNFSTTLSSDITDSATTIALNSASGLPTDTAVTLMIDRVDSNGDEQSSSDWELVTGVISGNNLTNALRGEGDTSASSHDSGAVVECVVDEESWNDMIDAILVEHDQDGTHNDVTGTTVTTSGDIETTGGAVKTDTVSEETADNGVSIDGLTIKDGGIPSCGASSETMLNFVPRDPSSWDFDDGSDADPAEELDISSIVSTTAVGVKVVISTQSGSGRLLEVYPDTKTSAWDKFRYYWNFDGASTSGKEMTFVEDFFFADTDHRTLYCLRDNGWGGNSEFKLSVIGWWEPLSS